jgi:hypothetical protein
MAQAEGIFLKLSRNEKKSSAGWVYGSIDAANGATALSPRAVFSHWPKTRLKSKLCCVHARV